MKKLLVMTVVLFVVIISSSNAQAFSSVDVLEIVFKLENMKISFDKFSTQSQSITDYYLSIGNYDEANRYSQVTELLSNAMYASDKLISYIRKNSDNPTSVLPEIQQSIEIIRGYVDEAILLLLEDTTTTNPNSLPITQKILDYLYSLPDKNENKVLSGQYVGIVSSENSKNKTIYEQAYQFYIEDNPFEKYNYEPLGHNPALLGWTHNHWNDNGVTYKPINNLILQHWNKGGLVILDTYMANPLTSGDHNDITSFDFNELITPGTVLNTNWRVELDRMAEGLQDLEDKGVVVLFAPFVEMNGDWFWWGQATNQEFIEMWKYLFNYYTYDKGLDNILWVYEPNEDINPNLYRVMYYYPGNEYVDIVGLSAYPESVNPVDIGGYNELIATGKPFGFAQFGPSKNFIVHNCVFDEDWCLEETGNKNCNVDYVNIEQWLIENNISGDDYLSRLLYSPVHCNWDYFKALNEIKEYFPKTVYVLSWTNFWSMRYNKNSTKYLEDPWIANRGELPPHGDSDTTTTTIGENNIIYGSVIDIDFYKKCPNLILDNTDRIAEFIPFSYLTLKNSENMNYDKISIFSRINIKYDFKNNSIIGKYDSTKDSGSWIMYTGDKGELNCVANINGQAISATSPSGIIKTNQWYSVGCIYDGFALTPYINGKQHSGVITGNIQNSNVPISIASFDKGKNQKDSFIGKIDNVKIWNRALSSSEVLDEYNGNSISNGNVLLLKFENLVNNEFIDSSGENHEAYCDLESNELTKYKEEFNNIFGIGTVQGHMNVIHSVSRDLYLWDALDLEVDWLEDNNKKIKLHSLTIAFDMESRWPDWYNESTQEEKRKALEEHVRNVTSRYKGRIYMYDAMNHPIARQSHSPINDYMGTGWNVEEAAYKILTWAHEEDPNAILILNEGGVILYPGLRKKYIELANELISRGAPLDGLGFMAHLAGDSDKSDFQLPSEEVISTALDEVYEETGLPIYITEFDIAQINEWLIQSMISSPEFIITEVTPTSSYAYVPEGNPYGNNPDCKKDAPRMTKKSQILLDGTYSVGVFAEGKGESQNSYCVEVEGKENIVRDLSENLVGINWETREGIKLDSQGEILKITKSQPNSICTDYNLCNLIFQSLGEDEEGGKKFIFRAEMISPKGIESTIALSAIKENFDSTSLIEYELINGTGEWQTISSLPLTTSYNRKDLYILLGLTENSIVGDYVEFRNIEVVEIESNSEVKILEIPIGDQAPKTSSVGTFELLEGEHNVHFYLNESGSIISWKAMLEIDGDSSFVTNEGKYYNTYNDYQAWAYRKFFDIVRNHEATRGLVVWGFYDATMHLKAGLFDEDFNEKPVYCSLLPLLTGKQCN